LVSRPNHVSDGFDRAFLSVGDGTPDCSASHGLLLAGALALLFKSAWFIVIAGMIWVLGLLFIAYVSGVAGNVYRCALYMYASEGVVPEPYNHELLDMAWKVKKSSGSFT
jgi:hypothetical protein